MSSTQYEILEATLSNFDVHHRAETGDVLASGIGPVPNGLGSPCITAEFSMTPPAADYYYTDSLTGCAGFVVMAGDSGLPFSGKNALVIHDAGGDQLQSSQKEIEKFIARQKAAGNNEIRIIWGNGIGVGGSADSNHKEHTRHMIERLEAKYAGLNVQHCPDQKTLAMSKSGCPINLSGSTTAGKSMSELCQGRDPTISETRYENEHYHVARGSSAPSVDYRLIVDPLNNGKLPDLRDIDSQRSFFNSKLERCPSNAIDLMNEVKKHGQKVPLLLKIHEQLEIYYRKSNDPSNSKKDMHRNKWWSLMTVANELIAGKTGKPMRPEVFESATHDKYFKDSLKATFSSTTKNLIDEAKAAKVIMPRLFLIGLVEDKIVRPIKQAAELSTTAPGQQSPYSRELDIIRGHMNDFLNGTIGEDVFFRNVHKDVTDLVPFLPTGTHIHSLNVALEEIENRGQTKAANESGSQDKVVRDEDDEEGESRRFS